MLSKSSQALPFIHVQLFRLVYSAVHTLSLALDLDVHNTCLCGLIKFRFSESPFCTTFLYLCGPSKQVMEGWHWAFVWGC